MPQCYREPPPPPSSDSLPPTPMVSGLRGQRNMDRVCGGRALQFGGGQQPPWGTPPPPPPSDAICTDL